MPRSSKDATAGIIFFLLAFTGALINLPSVCALKEVKSNFLKVIWRYIGLFVLICPKFIVDIIKNLDCLGKLLYSNVVPIIYLSFLNTVYVCMTYYAVNHTYIAHTLLLCSIATTFLTTWKIIRREQYTTIEYIGVGINVFGAYLCCCEGGTPEVSSKKYLITME